MNGQHSIKNSFKSNQSAHAKDKKTVEKLKGDIKKFTTKSTIKLLKTKYE